VKKYKIKLEEEKIRENIVETKWNVKARISQLEMIKEKFLVGDYLEFTQEEFLDIIPTEYKKKSELYLSRRIFNYFVEIFELDFDLKEFFKQIDFVDESKYLYIEEIQDYLDLLNDNPVYQYILYATFSGIGYKDTGYIADLRLDMIDGNTVTFDDGYTYEVDDLFIEIAQRCDKCYSYSVLAYSEKLQMRSHIRDYRFNRQNKHVLKPNGVERGADEKVTNRQVNNLINNVIEKISDKRLLNKKILEKSGLMHKMYLIEKEKGIIFGRGDMKTAKKYLPFNFSGYDFFYKYVEMYRKKLELEK